MKTLIGIFTVAFVLSCPDLFGQAIGEKLSQAAQAIILDTTYLGVGIRVPVSGLHDSAMSWACNDETAVIDDESEKDVKNRIWIRVKRPKEGVKNVVITAQVSIGEKSVSRDFNVPIACGYAQDLTGRNKVKVIAENMVYEDPVFDGAADPTLVYNRKTKEWWIVYTQRRAAVDWESGVSWVYGSEIGLARSPDGGTTWEYIGTAQGLALGKTPRDTYWAPEIVYNDGIYHMYLSYVTGVHSRWGGTATIEHYTSNDLVNWTHQSSVPGQPSSGIIDPCIFRLRDGRYAMWFKAPGSQTYISFSDDLYKWGPSANINIGGNQEAPNVFFWNGKYRMLLDNAQRLTLYSSEDGIYWPMGSKTDIGGQHCDVVTQGGENGEAIFLYFAENYNTPSGNGNKTALYLNKLVERDDGTVWCDHEAIYKYNLRAPEIRKIALKAYPSKTTFETGQILDFTGLELSVNFADSMHDTLKPVTREDFEEYAISSSIAPGSKLKKGDTDIVLSTAYGGSVTIPITVTDVPEKAINSNK